jgi:5-methylthioribose kinase
MREIDAGTAISYLRETGHVPDGSEVRVRELSGGVSNIVLRVDLAGRPPFVIKQCRERLRVAMEWLAPLDRIWTESAAIGVLHEILPEGTVPRVLFEDRPNYLFTMTCAPDDAVTWKSMLMDGRVDPEIAARLGTILGTIHAEGSNHPALRGPLADTSLFDQLRVDPYYRTVARRHPDLSLRIEALIAAMDRPAEERTLVLGDFSPKNILVHSGGLVLLDFECAHAGDPTFDIGFFLTHLLLKEVRAIAAGRVSHRRHDGLTIRDKPYIGLTYPFWGSYLERRNLEGEAADELIHRANQHTVACCMARVDGKSPVEYLDARGQALAKAFALLALEVDPWSWYDLLETFEVAVQENVGWRH